MYKAKELTSGSRASSAAFSVGVAAAPSFGVDSTFFDDFFLRKETLRAWKEVEKEGEMGWPKSCYQYNWYGHTYIFFSVQLVVGYVIKPINL